MTRPELNFYSPFCLFVSVSTPLPSLSLFTSLMLQSKFHHSGKTLRLGSCRAHAKLYVAWKCFSKCIQRLSFPSCFILQQYLFRMGRISSMWQRSAIWIIAHKAVASFFSSLGLCLCAYCPRFSSEHTPDIAQTQIESCWNNVWRICSSSKQSGWGMHSSLLFLSGDEPLLSSSAATSASLYRSAPQIGGQRAKKDRSWGI